MMQEKFAYLSVHHGTVIVTECWTVAGNLWRMSIWDLALTKEPGHDLHGFRDYLHRQEAQARTRLLGV